MTKTYKIAESSTNDQIIPGEMNLCFHETALLFPHLNGFFKTIKISDRRLHKAHEVKVIVNPPGALERRVRVKGRDIQILISALTIVHRDFKIPNDPNAYRYNSYSGVPTTLFVNVS
jgi:hypothetical protein